MNSVSGRKGPEDRGARKSIPTLCLWARQLFYTANHSPGLWFKTLCQRLVILPSYEVNAVDFVPVQDKSWNSLHWHQNYICHMLVSVWGHVWLSRKNTASVRVIMIVIVMVTEGRRLRFWLTSSSGADVLWCPWSSWDYCWIGHNEVMAEKWNNEALLLLMLLCVTNRGADANCRPLSSVRVPAF